MFCPECTNKLFTFTVSTDTGAVILDFCGNCGGIWTDKGEANFIKIKDLLPLIPFLPKKGKHSTIQYNLLCPKDRTTLEIYRAESVPNDVSLYHCLICKGMWFPEKMFFKFKIAQKAKINYFKSWKIPLTSVYSVLLPILLITILGGGVLLAKVMYQNQEIRIKAKDVISKPLVLQPEPGIAVINFNSEKAAIASIRYWLNLKVTTDISISTTPQKSHTIILKNLEIGRTYSYQIILRQPEEVTSPIYTFKTKEE